MKRPSSGFGQLAAGFGAGLLISCFIPVRALLLIIVIGVLVLGWGSLKGKSRN